MTQNNIIETSEMKLVYKKYLKQLVELQTNIVVIGSKESGKSAMIKLFVDKHFNGQMIIRGDNEEQALRELGKKLTGMGNTSQQLVSSQTSMQKLDYCIYIDDVSCELKLTKI